MRCGPSHAGRLTRTAPARSDMDLVVFRDEADRSAQGESARKAEIGAELLKFAHELKRRGLASFVECIPKARVGPRAGAQRRFGSRFTPRGRAGAHHQVHGR
jgi:hypothetical protein